MKIGRKPVLFATLTFLAAALILLPGCSLLGGSSSDLESRVSELETANKAKDAAIATLQQQLTAQKQRIDALTPAAAPAAPVTPAAPTTPSTPAAPKPLPSSSVAFDKLTITPAQANLGATVTITIDVTNTGSVEGTYNVVVTDQMTSPQTGTTILEYSNKVTMKPAETKTVTFTTSQNTAGTYTIKAGSKTGAYTVIDPNAPAQ